jgi:hypothetical protein
VVEEVARDRGIWRGCARLGFGASGRLCLDGEVEPALMIRAGWWRRGERTGWGEDNTGRGDQES